jgi:hypothetical protein
MKGVLCAGLILFLAGCSRSAPESERQLATRVLAEYVATAKAPKLVLVFSNPFSQRSGGSEQIYAFEEAGIAGLKEGFGNVRMEVEFPAIKPEALRDRTSVQIDPQSTTPLSFLVTDGAFSESAGRHPNADIIVSLIGLPVNLASFTEWHATGKPAFALLLPDWRMIGGREEILQSFRTGKLVAAIVRKANAPEGDVIGDSKEEFDRRYLLVTKENVEGLLAADPSAFGIR